MNEHTNPGLDIVVEVLTESSVEIQRTLAALRAAGASGLVLSAVQRAESALLDALAMARRHRPPDLAAEDAAIEKAERAGDLQEVERLLRAKEERAQRVLAAGEGVVVVRGEGFAIAPARKP